MTFGTLGFPETVTGKSRSLVTIVVGVVCCRQLKSSCLGFSLGVREGSLTQQERSFSARGLKPKCGDVGDPSARKKLDDATVKFDHATVNS